MSSAEEDDDLDDEKLEELRSAVQRIIRDNQDLTIKEIGDRVILWDSSRLTNYDVDQLIQPTEAAILINYESIVIEVGCDYISESFTWVTDNFITSKPPKTLDLVIWNTSTKKKYRTSSDFVKIK